MRVGRTARRRGRRAGDAARLLLSLLSFRPIHGPLRDSAHATGCVHRRRRGPIPETWKVRDGRAAIGYRPCTTPAQEHYQHEPAARAERCAPMGSREGAPSLKLVRRSPAAVVTSARCRSYPCLTTSRRRPRCTGTPMRSSCVPTLHARGQGRRRSTRHGRLRLRAGRGLVALSYTPAGFAPCVHRDSWIGVRMDSM